MEMCVSVDGGRTKPQISHSRFKNTDETQVVLSIYNICCFLNGLLKYELTCTVLFYVIL